MTVATAEDLIWFANQKVERIIAPPYDPNMLVTPFSRYSDTVYVFNRNNLTPGNKHKSELDFLSKNKFGDMIIKLEENTDEGLIELLRQITVAYFFRTDALQNHRVHVYKVGTLHRKFKAIKRLIVAAKICGASGQQDINTNLLNEVLTFLKKDEAQMSASYEVIEDLWHFNKAMLIYPPLELDAGYIVKGRHAVDNTVPKGRSAIPEEVISKIISASLEYISKSDNIIELINMIISGEWRSNKQVRQALIRELKANFPRLKSRGMYGYYKGAESILLMACANIIFFALGLRPSELLSIKRNAVFAVYDAQDSGDGRTYVTFTRYKGAEIPQAKRLLVSNRLREIGDVLDKLVEVRQSKSDYYFSLRGKTEEMRTENLKGQQQHFCRANAIPFLITPYNWRKTTVDLLIRSFTNGLSYAAAILDHIHEGESVAYGLSTPQLRDDLLSGIYGIWAERTKSLLEYVMEGEELGGLAGKRFQDAFASQPSQWQQETDKDKFVAEMLERHILPVKVAEGVYCVKSPLARGACSKEATDLLADPARCRATCSYQLQLPERLQIVEENIHNIRAFLGNPAISHMQKVHAVRQLRDQLVAWPEAVGKLEAAMSEDNSLAEWFK